MRFEGESLPTQRVLSEIIKRKNSVYDVVYFHGKSNASTIVIDELLRDYSSYHKNKNTIRTNGQAFLQNQLQNIMDGKCQSVLSEEELRNCDLLIFEEIDKIAGRQMTEQALYVLLDWLLEHNVQIVITGGVPIGHMDKLAPRIRTQIYGGISFRIL